LVGTSFAVNLPEKALFAFEPTSYFGVYRMEEFFFSS